MKPISLKMTAFGSYCDPAEIDFTKLYDNGIFLITGKTGGGKTTILDAICVALYGKATGSERAKDWKQMRCSSAPTELDTEVEFVFSINDVKYKFYRRWHQPKTRNGEAKINDAENACYIMYSGESEWTPLTTGKATQVNEAAENILKLNQSQFVKVIMLPQGEFRELLIASSDEKEKIFKKLFDTERWEIITERISEKYRRLHNEMNEHQNRIDIALNSLNCETRAELEVKISECIEQQKKLNAEKTLNEKQSAASLELLKAAEADLEKFNQLENLNKLLSELNTQAPQINEKKNKLAFSRKLREVESEYRLMLAAEANKRICENELVQAEQNEKNAAENLKKAEYSRAGLDALESKRSTLISDIANHSTLSKRYGEYDLAQNSINNTREELKNAERDNSELRAKKAETENNIQKAKQFIKECEEASRVLISVKEQLTVLERLYTNTLEYEQLSTNLTAYNKKLTENQQKQEQEEVSLKSCKIIEEAIEQRLRMDKAYSLASQLSEGVPCPVCGSVHHPKPAQPSDCTPKADELDVCRQNTETTRQRLEQTKQTIAALNADINSTQNRMNELISINQEGFTRSSDEIKALLDEMKKNEKALKNKADRLNPANDRLNLRTNELEETNKSIESKTSAINALNVKISADEQKIKSIDDFLKSHGIADFNTLAVKLKAERSELSQIEEQIKSINEAFTKATSQYSSAKASYQNTIQHYENSKKELTERQSAYKLKCENSDIPQDTDIETHLLSIEGENTLDRDIQNYEQKIVTVKSRINELSAQLDGHEKPAVDVIHEKVSLLQTKGKEISESIGKQSALHKNLTDTAKFIENEAKSIENKNNEYSTSQRLYQFCIGTNDSKTPLHQYVIGIKMDEVIMSANIYLQRLTKGQYSLIQKQSTSGRSKHQGLDIEIFDSNIGASRGVSTLSGGELFLASLSLAFGLSDTVQSFAGGIHLDSLFIDEGFGSLDSETLDTAMNAITSVRENKLLGIISHVSELKERIPSGIEVVKAPNGSALKLRS